MVLLHQSATVVWFFLFPFKSLLWFYLIYLGDIEGFEGTEKAGEYQYFPIICLTHLLWLAEDSSGRKGVTLFQTIARVLL